MEYKPKSDLDSDFCPLDTKDIYLKRGTEIIGLHSIGDRVPHEYDSIAIDGTVTHKITDFKAIESWGNEYDNEYNMLGRGSFRLFGDIEEVASELEAEGWIRFERDLCK